MLLRTIGYPHIGLLLISAAMATAVGAASHEGEGGHEEHAGDPPAIQMLSAEVGGKNVYIPATVVVASGKPQVLSIFNATEIPHGFKIEALGIEAVLPPGAEHSVELPAIEGNHVYRIQCQLHTAHRNATLVVMETED